MMPLADAEHFVRAPEWTWYILFYFFLAGLSGGSYVLATLLRLSGRRSDEGAARLGYYVAFVSMLICPVLLTLDLGKPERFWHMLVNTTPGDEAPIFKSWSPMSVGAWALAVFAIFATVSFVDALTRDRVIRIGLTNGLARVLGGAFGKLWNMVGAVLGLFIAGYTGVLLAVSNQPVWSDSWALGGLFLASGLSGSAALLLWLARHRRDARDSTGAVVRSERLFLVLEFALIVAFVVTLTPAGTLGRAFGFPWILLWLVALASLLPGLTGMGTRTDVTGDGTVAGRGVRTVAAPGIILTALVLIGVLALRAAVIFSAQ
jgi:formate-dependent nitrite reductase membrane component NrfD